jgi:hypothetical protein
MALIDYQTVLGGCCASSTATITCAASVSKNAKARYLESLRGLREFRFYASVQRSWCVARATKAAHLTLSLLHRKKTTAVYSMNGSSSGSGAQRFFPCRTDCIGPSILLAGGFVPNRPWRN